MSKPLFQDIVPPDRRSIKRIPVPERRQPIVRESNDEPLTYHPVSTYHEPKVPDRTTSEYVYKPDAPQKPKRRGARVVLGLLAVACIAGVFVIFAQGARGAKITLIPKGEMITLNNAQFTAADAKNEAAGDGLKYQVMSSSKDGSLAVPAQGEEQAEIRARGTIVIYNNYSPAAQVLVANTRFETKDGLIFRIQKPVTVPGQTTENGKKIPGSIEAEVVADQPGPKYNVGLADFTIPGFKGDPRYAAFKAMSKTPIEGGFSGLRKKVTDADAAAAREKIRAELKKHLVNQTQQQMPEGYVLPENAYAVTFTSLPHSQSDTEVKINERASINAVIFKRGDIAKAVAAKSDVTADSNADLLNADKLVFSTQATSTAFWAQASLSFTLKGTTTIVSVIDTEKLKTELAGKPRNSLNAVLSGYSGIAEAKVAVSPFWLQSFPSDPEVIEITIADPVISP